MSWRGQVTASQKESKVVDLLRELIVATIDVLCTKLAASRSTVLRALKTYGYFSSYNFNSSYFTLKDIPHFGKDGLWFHGDVGFSRYGTLTQTIKAVVEHSEAGYTVLELQKRLGTKIHNQLSWLCRNKMLTRFYVVGIVYILQWNVRFKHLSKLTANSRLGTQGPLARATTILIKTNYSNN